jgi:hypothetical protein
MQQAAGSLLRESVPPSLNQGSKHSLVSTHHLQACAAWGLGEEVGVGLGVEGQRGGVGAVGQREPAGVAAEARGDWLEQTLLCEPGLAPERAVR